MNVGQAITGTRHETERKVKDKRPVAQIDFMLRSRVSRDMTGKVKWFQHITVRPEPVEGQIVGLGNSP